MQRLTVALPDLPRVIKGLRRPARAELHDGCCPLHPVGAFAVNQMADDIEYGPGVFAFIAQRPCVRQIAQKRIESGGGCGSERYFLLDGSFLLYHPSAVSGNSPPQP